MAVKRMTNRNRECECGSGFMPTIMDQERNRWACRECRATGRKEAHRCSRCTGPAEDGEPDGHGLLWLCQACGTLDRRAFAAAHT